MLNINELKAKAASNDVSIVDVADGLYQIYSGDYAIGVPQDLEHLQNADKYGVFEEFEEGAAEVFTPDIEFLCTNGANSSFKVMAVNADVALMLAAKRFDSESDYVLPINVESEGGLTGATLNDPTTISYTDEELGLNDDYI
ncbi:hypothetical protein [Psychrobacter namhaensis]|uniref:hypothetical protein n=1 Tax=Psychrobacter namhaensis TaxID=292734 RepID=UPI0018DFC2B5|nr:hypothetical protein [Psychrobacter namhaensis]